MLALKHGDEVAFAELMRRHRGPIVRLRAPSDRGSRPRRGSRPGSFPRVYRHAGTYRVTARFTTWLYDDRVESREERASEPRIAGETCPWRTRPASCSKSDYHPGDARGLPRAGPIADLNDRQRKVRKAIDALPEHFRMMLVLRDLEGFAYEEIASMLELPLGTVKSRINAPARLEFKRRVEPMLRARRTNDPSVFWRLSRGTAPDDEPLAAPPRPGRMTEGVRRTHRVNCDHVQDLSSEAIRRGHSSLRTPGTFTLTSRPVRRVGWPSAKWKESIALARGSSPRWRSATTSTGRSGSIRAEARPVATAGVRERMRGWLDAVQAGGGLMRWAPLRAAAAVLSWVASVVGSGADGAKRRPGRERRIGWGRRDRSTSRVGTSAAERSRTSWIRSSLRWSTRRDTERGRAIPAIRRTSRG